jgi:predicted XRE-type DNA-binding protein
MNYQSTNQEYQKINTYVPYGTCLLKSGPEHRINEFSEYSDCVSGFKTTPDLTFKNTIDQSSYFNETYYDKNGNPDLQKPRLPDSNNNLFIQLASSTLHTMPDVIISVFFSDANIEHLRNTIVSQVKNITAQTNLNPSDVEKGVNVQKPDITDLWNYMINAYTNYKVQNGSICFVANNKFTDVKVQISKLNTNVLQEYISKLVSQINMYVHYYKDASELPEQLDLPIYNSMKGSRSLEYNTGFYSGNSMYNSRYNQIGNIY